MTRSPRIARNLVLLALLMAGSRATEAQTSPPAPESPDLLALLDPGDYLNHEYVESLKRTRSQRLSVGYGGAPELATVHRNGFGSTLGVGYQWHSSGGRYLYEPGRKCLVVGDLLPESGRSFAADQCAELVLQVVDRRSLSLDARAFDYVGDAERFIRSILVGGVYRDDNGRQYVFRADGSATFPTGGLSLPAEPVSYQLCLDPIGPPCGIADRLYDRTHNMAYAYERSAETLTIFKDPGELEQPDRAHPLVILHRLSDSD